MRACWLVPKLGVRPWAVCHVVPGYSTRYGVRRDQLGEFRGQRNVHRPSCTRCSDVNQVPYTDCSTTHGVLSIDPLVLRFANGTPGEIYGNSGTWSDVQCNTSSLTRAGVCSVERYNYDGSQAFNYSTFPVSRCVAPVVYLMSITMTDVFLGLSTNSGKFLRDEKRTNG